MDVCVGDTPPATWYSSAGKGHRLDYSAPVAWTSGVPAAFAPEHLDLTMDRIDYLPVAVEVVAPVAAG
eukprot:14128752-Alexandrium_andersonii.AAC.1